MGLTYKDYVRITNYSGKSIVVPYYVPKGYSQGQALYNQKITYQTEEDTTEKLSWGHVIYMANQNMMRGTTALAHNPHKNDESPLVSLITTMMDNLFDYIRSVIGFHNTEELMFSKGPREGYYYGLFSMSWLMPIQTIYNIAMVIAYIFISLAIVKALIEQNAKTMIKTVKKT
jgi:hypothetical protein